MGRITCPSQFQQFTSHFGKTQLTSSFRVYTLARFECDGQVAVSGGPKSSVDLYQIGRSLSGLYSVMEKKQVEFVSATLPNYQQIHVQIRRNILSLFMCTII